MRENHWRIVRTHLEALGYLLFTGDSVGPVFSRSEAVNRAAETAGDWDVALITDADTILDPPTVEKAIRSVVRSKGAARPHDQRYMLSLGATKWLTSRGVETLPARFLKWTSPGGGALVVHREAWDAVGGYDERFVGPGYEDSAMNIALVDRWKIVKGPCYHLFHPPWNHRSPGAQANRTILDDLRVQHADRIKAASEQVGFDLNTVL